MAWKRLLLLAAIASLGAAALLAILVLLLGDFGETEWRTLLTTFAIAGASLLALPAGVLVERGGAPLLARLSLGLVALTFVLVLVLIWGYEDETFGKATGTIAAVTAAATQAAAVELVRRDDVRAVRVVALVVTSLGALAAALVAFAIWAEPDSEAYARALAALVVLDVFLLVLLPLLRRLTGRDGTQRLVLEGTPEQLAAALERVEGTGVSVRR